MTTAIKHAVDCKLYRNTGTVGSPTWNLIDNVGSVTPTGGTHEKKEVPLRVDGNIKGYALGRTDVGYEFKMPQIASDADLTALQTAFYARDSIDFAIMDGAIATAGSDGIRGSFLIAKCKRSEDIDDMVYWEFEITPEAGSGNMPARMTVS